MNSVNVFKRTSAGNAVIYSYEDTPEGNRQAEKLFKGILETKNCLDFEIERAIEDGFFESGDWELYLIHN